MHRASSCNEPRSRHVTWLPNRGLRWFWGCHKSKTVCRSVPMIAHLAGRKEQLIWWGLSIPIISKFLSIVRQKKNAILNQLPNPPTARNPNYRGSRCLTLTSGHLMYPNIGANITGGIAVWVAAKETRQLTQRACRIRTPVHVASSTNSTTIPHSPHCK